MRDGRPPTGCTRPRGSAPEPGWRRLSAFSLESLADYIRTTVCRLEVYRGALRARRAESNLPAARGTVGRPLPRPLIDHRGSLTCRLVTPTWGAPACIRGRPPKARGGKNRLSRA